MNQRILRILVLLWLAWYVWGPVDPVVDWWDTPRQTMSDMDRAAGGIVVLMAAGFAVALLQSRNLRDRFRAFSHTALGFVTCLSPLATVPFLSNPSELNHGPPVPLRI